MSAYIDFNYNDLGRGNIRIFENGNEIYIKSARTGSIDGNGSLTNAIPYGKWFIKDPSSDTTENAMIIHPEIIGWKKRLYNYKKESTHYLFHPDGNKPGSLGCIVTPDMAYALRIILDYLTNKYSEVPVFINTKVEL